MNMSVPRDNDIFANIKLPPNHHSVMGLDDLLGGPTQPSAGRESFNGSPDSAPATMMPPTSVSSTSGGSPSSSPSLIAGVSGLVDDSKSFPLVLHAIVSDESSDKAIHWLPCGSRFVIANKDEFSSIILPHYFGGRGNASSGGATTKFTSFTRRLKRWNFSRVPSGREMGAYYHPDFKRGELGMARKIMYPVNNKGQQAGGGKPGGGKASRRPSATAKTVVSKARRRASTGSIAVPVKFDPTAALELGGISPTPIKPMVQLSEGSSIPALPVEDNDLKNWLSSADFAEDCRQGVGSAFNDAPPSFDAAPASVVSSTSSGRMLHPQQLAFPNNFMCGSVGGGSQHGSGHGSGSQHGSGGGGSQHRGLEMNPGLGMCSPGTMMRRHSVQMGSLVAPPPLVGSISEGVQNSSAFNPSQLLGMNFSCNNPTVVPQAPTSSGFMNFSAPTYMPLKQSKPLAEPQPDRTGSGASREEKDPFGFSRDFSFDDLNNMMDPFT